MRAMSGEDSDDDEIGGGDNEDLNGADFMEAVINLNKDLAEKNRRDEEQEEELMNQEEFSSDNSSEVRILPRFFIPS